MSTHASDGCKSGSRTAFSTRHIMTGLSGELAPPPTRKTNGRPVSRRLVGSGADGVPSPAADAVCPPWRFPTPCRSELIQAQERWRPAWLPCVCGRCRARRVHAEPSFMPLVGGWSSRLQPVPRGCRLLSKTSHKIVVTFWRLVRVVRALKIPPKVELRGCELSSFRNQSQNQHRIFA